MPSRHSISRLRKRLGAAVGGYPNPYSARGRLCPVRTQIGHDQHSFQRASRGDLASSGDSPCASRSCALIFAVLDVGLVVWTYVSQPELLAEELLTLQAHKLERSAELMPEALEGPPGAARWSASYYVPAGSGRRGRSDRRWKLIDWTRRERIEGGLRITGVRSIVQAGQPRWLLMEFEGSGSVHIFL